MTDGDGREFTRKRGGSHSTRRFGAVAAVAAVLSTAAFVTFFTIGMVGAALGIGVGGFVANFDNVSASQGAEIFPVVGEQAACDEAPQLQASLDGTAELSGGVEFFKDMPLPSPGDFPNDDFARITIVGQDDGTPIQVSGLSLRLSALETDSLSLGGADIQEFGPGDYEPQGDLGIAADGSYIDTTNGFVVDEQDSPTVYNKSGNKPSALDTSTDESKTPEFGIRATSFSLKNGTAATQFVSLGSISLSEVNIAVQILNESEDTENGPITRVVSPDERTCDALAEASTSKNATNLNESSGGLDLATGS
jgi:hypothetical protein